MNLIVTLFVISISPFIQVVGMKTEDKCRIVKSILRRYQTTCVFLLNQDQGNDLESESLTFKYLSEFSRDFIFVADKWRWHSTSREMCQPFVYAFHGVSQVDAILKTLTETSHRTNAKLVVFEDTIGNETQFFRDVYIPLDTEFLLVKKPNNNEEVAIDELYHVIPNTTLRTNEIGQWRPDKDKGILDWTTKSYSTRRNNFYGIELKAAFTPFVRMVYEVKNNDDKTIKLGGFVYEIWDILQEALNFKTHFQRVPEGRFGIEDDNGTWNGMAGMLQRKQVDIGLMALMLSTSRLRVVDNFHPVKRSRFVVIIRRGTKDSTFDQIFKPLSRSVWISVVFTIILVSIFLEIIWSNSVQERRNATKCTISNSVLSVVATFSLRGPDWMPNAWPTRIVIISSSVIGVVAYSAMLVSILAMSRYEIPIRNIKQLTDHGRYKLGLVQNSTAVVYFEDSRDPAMVKAYEKLVLTEKDHPQTIEDGLRRVCERNKYAFITISQYHEQILPDLDLPCTQVYLPEVSFTTSHGIPCAKHSPFKRIINTYIIKMHERGLLEVQYSRLRKNKLEEEEEEVEERAALSLETLSTMFILLFAGMASSTLILFLEICHKRLKKTK
ncbi:Ionotropic receptor 156 [Blattella germanica]|nr:Ionotropic receptor 156 [Blattella germanica]